jgi:hypothetical protein
LATFNDSRTLALVRVKAARWEVEPMERSHVLAIFAGALLWGSCVADEPTASPGSDAGGADAGPVTGDAVAPAESGLDAAVTDAPSDATPPYDATPDAPTPRCDPNKPFGAPSPVTAIDTAGWEESAHLSPDELTIYFSGENRDDAGTGWAIWVATRATTTSAFSAATLLPGISPAAYTLRGPSVSGDGLDLYATRTYGGGVYGIVASHRASTAVDFGAPVTVSNVNPTSDVEDPYVLPNGNVLYLAYTPGDGGVGGQIFRAEKSVGSFGPPVSVVGVNQGVAGKADFRAAVTPDELTIFFTSDRPGSIGTYDIYEAHRTSTSAAFNTPVDVAVLNVAGAFSWPSWVSDDGCVLYFTSDRTGGAGQYDVWVAARGK